MISRGDRVSAAVKSHDFSSSPIKHLHSNYLDWNPKNTFFFFAFSPIKLTMISWVNMQRNCAVNQIYWCNSFFIKSQETQGNSVVKQYFITYKWRIDFKWFVNYLMYCYISILCGKKSRQCKLSVSLLSGIFMVA